MFSERPYGFLENFMLVITTVGFCLCALQWKLMVLDYKVPAGTAVLMTLVLALLGWVMLGRMLATTRHLLGKEGI